MENSKKVRVYQYPRNIWIQSLETDKWYSQSRNQADIDRIKQSVSDMTSVSVKEIPWNSNRNQISVVLP